MKSIILVFGIILAAQLATAQGPGLYRAGVVEFQTRRLNGTNPDYANETLTNTRRFVDLINSTEARDVHILVFPEAVLNFPQTAVPVPRPSDNITACGNQTQHPLIQTLSCAANQSSTYVVVQLYMSVNCTEDNLQNNDTRACTNPQNNTNIYSAAVVFNRNGAVVAVYRKFNTYNEPNVRKPLRADNTTFTTDFGVTFGVFICFDILFDAPANNLVNSGVRHFVSPSLWSSELPYLTALQTQQMWAYRQNVNLLVAGGNLPSEGSTGSGIYSGRLGLLAFEFSNMPLTRLVIAEIPRNPGTFDTDSAIRAAPAPEDEEEDYGTYDVVELAETKASVLPGLNLTMERLNNYNVQFLNVSNSTEFKGRLCLNSDNNVCCEYDIAVSLTDPEGSEFYSYAVAVFNGYRQHGIGGTRRLHTKQMICSVVACARFNLHQTCGLRLSGQMPIRERVRFDRLVLRAQIITGNTGRNGTLVMANTLTRDIHPMTPTEFQFTLGSNDTPNQNQTAEIRLLRPRNDVQTFAIFARNSKQDFYTSASKTIAVNGLLLLALSAIIAMFSH